MLMDNKNFRFTPIPDKTNDLIFLKSPKTLFWVIFAHFCPMGIFSKESGSVTHNFIWAPNTVLRFRKKLISQFRENLQTDREGWTEGWTDRPYFIRPSRPGSGGPNKNYDKDCQLSQVSSPLTKRLKT